MRKLPLELTCIRVFTMTFLHAVKSPRARYIRARRNKVLQNMRDEMRRDRYAHCCKYTRLFARAP